MWKDNILILSFSFLGMLSISSLKIFKIADYNLFESNSNVWASSKQSLLSTFSPSEYGLYFVFLHISFLLLLLKARNFK